MCFLLDQRFKKKKLKQKFDLVCNTHCAVGGNQPHMLSFTQSNSVRVVFIASLSLHSPHRLSRHPPKALVSVCLCMSTNYKITSVCIHIHKFIGEKMYFKCFVQSNRFEFFFPCPCKFLIMYMCGPFPRERHFSQ